MFFVIFVLIYKFKSFRLLTILFTYSDLYSDFQLNIVPNRSVKFHFYLFFYLFFSFLQMNLFYKLNFNIVFTRIPETKTIRTEKVRIVRSLNYNWVNKKLRSHPKTEIIQNDQQLN